MCKKATWRFIIANIFANVFILVQTSQFPEFFDDDDLKSIGAKGHKSRHTPPATTGHYTDNMPGYVPAIPNDQNTANIPPNGMPVHYMPPQMLKKRPFKPIGRGDPSNQNIVEQMDEENDESIFPEPDGKPYGGHDFEDLDQLTNRLSKTNKWDEFKALLAQEGEQYKDGRIMKNWEDDAHMWASYSRHLLERTDHEQRKQADRQARPPTHHDPSIGLQQYWAEDTADQGPDRGPAESEGLGGSLGLGGGWSPGGSQGPSGGRGTGGGWGQGGQGPGGGWMGMGGPPPPNWKPGARRPSWSQGGPPGPGNGQGPGGGWGQGGPPGPSGGRGPDGGWGQGGPPGPGGGWGQGGPPGSGGDRGSGGPPGPGGGWGQGGPPGPGRGWGQGGPPGLGGGLGQGGPPGPTGGWGQGGPPGLGGGLGQGGPPGPAGRWSQGGPPGPGGGRGQGGPPGPGGGQSPGGGRGPGNGRGQSGPPGPGGGQGPVKHRRPPMTWIRRQMNDDMQANNNPDDYSDNLKGALDHSMQPPPLYYQGNNPDMPDFRPGLPQDKIQRGKDDRYLLPEQRNGNIPAEMNYPDVLSLGNLEKNLPPMPRLNKSTPFDKPERLFSPSINNDLIPGYTGGKMPGPGSESDYPNGYRPYGNNLMIPGMGSGPPDGGFGNFGMSQQSPRGSYPVAQKKPPGYGPQGKPTGLREGGGFPSSGDYSVPEGGPGDYPDDIQKALRMGGPGGFPSQPGPGSEGAFPQGFQPPHGNIQGGRPPWMKGGRPPGMLGGRSPNMQDNGPPNMQNDGPPGWGPESPPSLAGGFSPPGEPAYRPPEIEMPPGMPSGPVYPEYGRPSGASNRNPGYASDQQGFKPRNKYLPSGYDLMRIAKKQIAVQDYLIQRSGKMPSVQTTTEHIPTKQERIMKLRQFDDFHAPIRWVPLTSADTRDGLARVTDKESHKNQQFVIEGELYVPIVDERMSRLGWTTEDSNTTVTEITIKPPVDDTAIKVVMRSMNLNNSNELEWLAYETVLGAKHAYENECDGESCQARCRKTGCDCTCRGPGCFSMCIGEQCTAKCWGTHCEATCSKLTCSSTVNGLTSTSNSTWDQMYPQYDHKYSNPDEVQPQGPAPGTVPSNDYYD